MKLIGYTTTYNSAEMIPYVMPYVERIGYDKFIVYDNGSTDNTIDILSQYPFVEIRHYETPSFSERDKINIMCQGYIECFRKAKVNQPDEELIWMTFTDFDEVLFCSEWGKLRMFLEFYYTNFHYNCFHMKMINLFNPSNKALANQIAHANEGIRGKWWTDGDKCILFAVNDFYEICPCYGNHKMDVIMREGKHAKNLNDTGIVHAFHLKYIDKELQRRYLGVHATRNTDNYQNFLEDYDNIYNTMLSSTFPIEMYFYGKINDMKDDFGGIHEKNN